MNAERRKQIDAAIATLNAILSQLGEVHSEIESIRDAEQEAYDNLPESLQEGDRGAAMQEAIDALENAAGAVADLDIDSITTDLETARDAGR